MDIFTDYIKLLNDLTETKEQEKEYDVNELKDTVKKLKNNPIFNLFADIFGVNGDEFADEVLKNLEKSEKETSEANKIKRPSETIPTNVGLQIHKLVQEYVDTMIKPYNTGALSDTQINDAYAGLYEFACWIFQHK